MEGFVTGERLAYNHMTFVTIYQATCLARNRPVVLKKHEFHMIDEPGTQDQINVCLNAALFQAKVQHPNSCEVLEVKVHIEKANCYVYHVLEALDTSVGKDVEAGKRYEEPELRQFLQQTASALAFAHSKGIAHRDVKPDNVFRTANTFKLGDFGCFFEKKLTSYTTSYAGDERYMSPQLRKACIRKTPYNAFKADVFALGASLLHLATLTSPRPLVTLKQTYMQEKVNSQVQALSCSEELKDLIKRMLAYEEGDRPTMSEVCAALVQPEEVKSPRLGLAARLQTSQSALLRPTTAKLVIRPGVRRETKPAPQVQTSQLVHVTESYIRFLNFQTFTWGQPINLSTQIQVNKWSIWVVLDDGRVFCCGGEGTNSAWIVGRGGTVEEQPSMTEVRCLHGVLVLSAVYVFGGIKRNSCEKFPLGSPQWRTLPPMHQARFSFNPCFYVDLARPKWKHLPQTQTPSCLSTSLFLGYPPAACTCTTTS